MLEAMIVPRLLTTKQLAAATGLPLWRLYQLMKEGKGPPAIRIGRTLRFPEDGVVRWIEEMTRASAS